MTEWIRVEDKLPDDGDIVLIWNGKSPKKLQGFMVAYFVDGYFYDRRKNIAVFMPHFFGEHITHWAKLQKPPEVQNDTP